MDRFQPEIGENPRRPVCRWANQYRMRWWDKLMPLKDYLHFPFR